MVEKKFKNVDLGIEITSYIDKQQNIWFCGKDVAKYLGIVTQEMHYQDMLIKRIKNKYLIIVPASTKRGRWLQIPASTKRGRWHQVEVCVLISTNPGFTHLFYLQN